MHLKSRPAVVGDKLVVKDFGTGTTGFAAMGADDPNTPVCVMPGTEMAFEDNITRKGGWFLSVGAGEEYPHKTAIFRQINKEHPHLHHDALEMPDGSSVLLNYLRTGQHAVVLQLPAAPKTAEEAKAQERLPVTA
jgi:hypothetical protein